MDEREVARRASIDAPVVAPPSIRLYLGLEGLEHPRLDRDPGGGSAGHHRGAAARTGNSRRRTPTTRLRPAKRRAPPTRPRSVPSRRRHHATTTFTVANDNNRARPGRPAARHMPAVSHDSVVCLAPGRRRLAVPPMRSAVGCRPSRNRRRIRRQRCRARHRTSYGVASTTGRPRASAERRPGPGVASGCADRPDRTRPITPASTSARDGSGNRASGADSPRLAPGRPLT